MSGRKIKVHFKWTAARAIKKWSHNSSSHQDKNYHIIDFIRFANYEPNDTSKHAYVVVILRPLCWLIMWHTHTHTPPPRKQQQQRLRFIRNRFHILCVHFISRILWCEWERKERKSEKTNCERMNASKSKTRRDLYMF